MVQYNNTMRSDC